MAPNSSLANWLTKLRNRYFFALDAAGIIVSALLSFVLSGHRLQFDATLGWFVLLALMIKLSCFHRGRFYRRFWMYASGSEFAQMGLVTLIASALFAAGLYGVLMPLKVITIIPWQILAVDWLITLAAVSWSRLGVRGLEYWLRQSGQPSSRGLQRVLLVGAGPTAAMIVSEMQAKPSLGLLPVGFLDDSLADSRVSIRGVPVLGKIENLADYVRGYKVQQVIIALPDASGKLVRQIMQVSEKYGAQVRVAPDIAQVLQGRLTVSRVRDVQIEDLLRREPVRTDMTQVRGILAGKRVLVTGAGGSIGAELCRQLVKAEPAHLTLLGHGENSLFSISNELSSTYPGLSMSVVVADIRDWDRLVTTFRRECPDVIFHAAAHKHVPLMELNVEEAVLNNVLGTRNLLRVAVLSGVERFVLISTDKAVNPTSVMGATKRIAELMVRNTAFATSLPFVAVRFGNVLGSRGSVVPLFREQIARGGPVTVTHPDMKRYFMTIPEASQLVLQAASLGHGGEIFVLDMGTQVRILDLARDLIELSGYQVGRDIDIVFTGLRPGEKLYEEIFIDSEKYSRTEHEKVFVSHESSYNEMDAAAFEQAVEQLVERARAGDPAGVRALLKQIVPEFSGWPPSNNKENGFTAKEPAD